MENQTQTKKRKLRLKIRIKRWFRRNLGQPKHLFVWAIAIFAITLVYGYSALANSEYDNVLTETARINNEVQETRLYLQEVLAGTPMEEAIPHIIKASEHFRVPVELIVGVANAESSLGKHMPEGCYNPFGIKPNGKLKYYSDWEHSINGFANLVKEYYIEEGFDSPDRMMMKYVGYRSDAWVSNVKVHWDPKV